MEIWQYGSNEELDLKWEQDGVAPQCAVTGINVDGINPLKYGRAFIPEGEIKDFAGSHLSANYNWVFTLGLTDKGFVKTR